jgi:coenzyme Q-binding protein COQ10
MAYKRIITNLPFHAQDIYNLVTNIQNYPLFVPHCNQIEIHNSTEQEIIATMHIEYFTVFKTIKFTYTSKVTLNPNTFSVSIEEFPQKFFKIFESIWHIRPTISGCQVTYDIKFEINNPLLNLTLSNLFLENSHKMIEAFTKQAHATLTPIK